MPGMSKAQARQRTAAASAARFSQITPASSTPVASAASSFSSTFGVGVDIAHIPRFAGIYKRHGLHFLRKCLHPDEIVQMQKISNGSGRGASVSGASVDSASAPTTASATSELAAATFLASRWAAKEAMVKASGQRLLFPHMRVSRDSNQGAEGHIDSATTHHKEEE